MSASLDDETSTDGWSDWSLPPGAGFLVVLGVIGLLALLLGIVATGKPSSRGLGREPAAVDGGR